MKIHHQDSSNELAILRSEVKAIIQQNLSMKTQLEELKELRNQNEELKTMMQSMQTNQQLQQDEQHRVLKYELEEMHALLYRLVVSNSQTQVALASPNKSEAKTSSQSRVS